MNIRAQQVCKACHNRPLGRPCETCNTLWVAPQDEDDRPRWRASRWMQGIQDTDTGTREIDVKRVPGKL